MQQAKLVLGDLVYVRDRVQSRSIGGEDTSAGILIALVPSPGEDHAHVQRLRHASDEFDVLDQSALETAGQILKASKGDSAILRDLRAQVHLEVAPIRAITVGGWSLIEKDPFMGLPHWVPGHFTDGEDIRYDFGPPEREGLYRVSAQAYILSETTAGKLRSLGVEVESPTYSSVRTSDFREG